MNPPRPWAGPLAPLYAAVVAANDALYTRRLLHIRSLTRPVVSIGSLSAGGAGKTPVVLALAQLLHQDGIAVDILSRGYGRSSQQALQVDPAGPASRFGDEPLELAQALASSGISVFVAPERFAAGRLAEASAKPAIHLLDDGFQHRRLARALDLVLFTREELAGHLLPAGNLREPLSALRRAGAVLLREEEQDLAHSVRAHSAAEVWIIRRHLTLPRIPPRPFVFCGIARPANLLAMLDAADCQPVGESLFRDHHAYTPADIAAILHAARQARAESFLTTAKDAVKLTPAMLASLAAAGPVLSAKLTVTFLDPDLVLERLRGLLDRGLVPGPPLPEDSTPNMRK
jgi:tetraacyldisaccharide 4'-kinase